MSLHRYPKVELHLHLDCSIGYRAAHAIEPSLSLETFERDFVLNQACTDLADFLTKVPRSLSLLQEANHLRLVTVELVRQLAEENVIYAEIRFAPLLHCEQGLTSREVVSCVLAALKDAQEQYGVSLGLILCTLRHFSEEQGLETARLAHEFMDLGVVGIDLAADEAGYPIFAHRPAFAYALHNGINRTAHAGEALGPESMWETLEILQPQRIGHGVRAIEDPKLVEHLAQSQVHLEVCPGCNVMIGVFPDMESHSVDQLLRSGVSLGINTDGRTLPKRSLNQEYSELQGVFSWNKIDFLKTNLFAMQASFTDTITKDRYLSQLKQAYDL